MRLVRFVDTDGHTRWGEEVDDARARLIDGDPIGGRFTVTPRVASVVRRLAPVDPPNIIAVGRNYPEHAAEMKASASDPEPLLFLKATTSVIGQGDPIVLPASAPDEVDFEAELAVIIGRKVKSITEADAPSCVAGYTCANDVSARDCQKRRDKQWARAKSFDTFCPLGPVLVTADALDPAGRDIRSLLNGRVMQESNTGRMNFSVAQLISYISRQFTLLPGTVILTGTPSGVGAARTPPVYLRPGDNITVSIDGIGTLSNPVRATSESL
jgi:2-keto-4-pentenoate hydratase/2-oxohepta-3-ene-1,7-dioic acid hydratase in catechol pathway